MKAQLTSVQSTNVCDDCVAVCAPGIVLSIPLLYERIVLRPFTNPQKVSDIRIESDQLYDLLLQPETGPADKLLFLAPTVLFSDLHDAAQSLLEHVQVESLLASDSWHYPNAPEMLPDDDQVKITVHNPHLKPSDLAFETHLGELGSAAVSLPERLQNLETLAAMVGLKRTVFECTLTPPVEVGERRWLRLRIKPPRIFPPGKLATELNPETGLAGEHSQLLDILGADALLDSLRDTLKNSLKPDVFGKKKLAETQDARFRTAISDLFVYTFKDGFEKEGTYTLVSDHRITLTAENIKIQFPTTEGSIKHGEVAPIRELGSLGHHWYGGLRFFSKHDPLIAASRIYEYALNYASTPEDAKSKEDCTYATSVSHPLGSELIDLLTKEAWQYLRSANGGKTFYLDPAKRLPKESKSRYMELIKIASQVAKKIRPAKAHFRIFFDAQWRQLAEEHKKRVRWRIRKDRLIFVVTILGFILAIWALIISLRTTQPSTNVNQSTHKTNELDKTQAH